MITSTANKQVKELAQLIKKAKERKEQKVFVVEGIRMFLEAPKEWVQAVYASESFLKEAAHRECLAGYAYEELSDSVFASVSDTKTPQGILCVVRMPEYKKEELFSRENGLYLVLESIQDPGNLGTMFRTGEGAGISGVILNRTTVDLFNPKTIRSTMGSIYRVPFYIADDFAETIRDMKQKGIRTYAAHLEGKKSYDGFDYRGSSAFLIGNEGNGLSDEIASLADTYIRIPMAGQVESLNAAMASGILMYEAARQRRGSCEAI